MTTWVVTLREGQSRQMLLSNARHVVTRSETIRSAQIIEAEDERAAVSAYRCSVWDLDVGLELDVTPLLEPTASFRREYSKKGRLGGMLSNDLSQWPADPVTVELARERGARPA